MSIVHHNILFRGFLEVLVLIFDLLLDHSNLHNLILISKLIVSGLDKFLIQFLVLFILRFVLF